MRSTLGEDLDDDCCIDDYLYNDVGPQDPSGDSVIPAVSGIGDDKEERDAERNATECTACDTERFKRYCAFAESDQLLRIKSCSMLTETVVYRVRHESTMQTFADLTHISAHTIAFA